MSTPTHIPAHICIHAHILARTHAHAHTCTHAQALTHLHTRSRVLTLTRAYKTKMHSQTLRTYTYKYTRMLTRGHEHASAHRIYRLTHKHTLVHAHLRVRAHTL